MNDVFEAARQSFFSGTNGDAPASPCQIFTQVKSFDGPVPEGAISKPLTQSAKPELLTARKRRLPGRPAPLWTGVDLY